MRPRVIGLIAHTGKAGASELIHGVRAEFAARQLPVLVETATAALVGEISTYSVADLAREADLLVVLGGDGTILNAVGGLTDTMKPIFGINIGSLGFLTCAASSAYKEAVGCIAAGNIELSQRALLDVHLNPAGPETNQVLRCLNDAVFSRGEISRLIRLTVRVMARTSRSSTPTG
jgi:NAD+ kinase